MMKKRLMPIILLLMLTVSLLIGAKAESNPLITYDALISGEYASETIRLNCVIGSNHGDFFDIWYEGDNDYYYDTWFSFEIGYNEYLTANEKEQLNNSSIGDKYCIEFSLYDDSSFGSSSMKSISLVEQGIDVNAFIDAYKNKCQTITCKSILRNPSKFEQTNTYVKFSGTVLQKTTDIYGANAFLLDTGEDNGIVFLNYAMGDNDMQLLETDIVTVYGWIPIARVTETYQTLIGTKTVPYMIVDFCDIEE